MGGREGARRSRAAHLRPLCLKLRLHRVNPQLAKLFSALKTRLLQGGQSLLFALLPLVRARLCLVKLPLQHLVNLGGHLRLRRSH